MKDYKWAVYIGRFQPFHNAHLQVIKHGLKIADHVIVVVGSKDAAPTIKNPFTFEEREEMILNSLSAEDKRNTNVVGIRDYYYNENTWIANIQALTSAYIQEGDSVALLGAFKDESSYYLKSFPQWEFIPCKTTTNQNATELRDVLFSQQPTTGWADRGVSVSFLDGNPVNKVNIFVPTAVTRFLTKFVQTERYVDLCKEFEFLNKYKAQWAKAPFPPTFVTADAVVVCSGHVLLVSRRSSPGKGLLALPGGFVRGVETIQNAALRELKEETGIRVDKLILESSIADSHVFDFPERSLRGRTITHAYYIKLKDGKLPEVKGNDDAEKAQWISLADFAKLTSQTFEDHSHIVQFFTNRI